MLKYVLFVAQPQETRDIWDRKHEATIKKAIPVNRDGFIKYGEEKVGYSKSASAGVVGANILRSTAWLNSSSLKPAAFGVTGKRILNI